MRACPSPLPRSPNRGPTLDPHLRPPTCPPRVRSRAGPPLGHTSTVCTVCTVWGQGWGHVADLASLSTQPVARQPLLTPSRSASPLLGCCLGRGFTVRVHHLALAVHCERSAQQMLGVLSHVPLSLPSSLPFSLPAPQSAWRSKSARLYVANMRATLDPPASVLQNAWRRAIRLRYWRLLAAMAMESEGHRQMLLRHAAASLIIRR